MLFRRVSRLGTDEIIALTDSTLATLTRYIPEYHRTRNPELLGEAKLAAEALHVMIAELETRQGVVSEIAPARQSGRHY